VTLAADTREAVRRHPFLYDGLRAGELVMTGGINAAIDVEPGDVYTVRFGSIGSIEVRAE
jgi:2-keto-4-pentenoate hydratase